MVIGAVVPKVTSTTSSASESLALVVIAILVVVFVFPVVPVGLVRILLRSTVVVVTIPGVLEKLKWVVSAPRWSHFAAVLLVRFDFFDLQFNE
jgi:hypothetical protein